MARDDALMPFGTIGPKTIASIVAGLALIAAAIWIYITIVHIRAENASLTSANAQLTADLSQAKADNQADLKALADLKADYAQQQAALTTAQTALQAASNQTQTIVTKVIRAPASDKACFPIALGNAFSELFPVSTNGSNQSGGGKGEGQSGVLRAVPGVAASATGPGRLEVTIHPAH